MDLVLNPTCLGSRMPGSRTRPGVPCRATLDILVMAKRSRTVEHRIACWTSSSLADGSNPPLRISLIVVCTRTRDMSVLLKAGLCCCLAYTRHAVCIETIWYRGLVINPSTIFTWFGLHLSSVQFWVWEVRTPCGAQNLDI